MEHQTLNQRLRSAEGQTLIRELMAANPKGSPASLLLSLTPSWRPTPMDETFFGVQPAAHTIICSAASNEIGFSMVHKSPFFSWIRGASITPNGATERQRSRSTFVRVLFDEGPTLAALVWRRANGSHA